MNSNTLLLLVVVVGGYFMLKSSTSAQPFAFQGPPAPTGETPAQRKARLKKNAAWWDELLADSEPDEMQAGGPSEEDVMLAAGVA